MVLVDSSVWVDYFNGTVNAQTDKLDELMGSGTVLVGDLMLAEVLQGFRHDREYRLAKAQLLEFPMRAIVSESSALAAAEFYRKLRKRGITVRKTVDSLIAAHCIAFDTALLYSDRDFEPFRKYFGLRSALT